MGTTAGCNCYRKDPSDASQADVAQVRALPELSDDFKVTNPVGGRKSVVGAFGLRNFCPINDGKVENFFECDKDILAEGGFGAVRKGRDNRTGIMCAVKTIQKDALADAHVFAKFNGEIEIMRSVDHPNIIRFRESFEDHKQIHVVLDFCEGGDLLQAIAEETLFTESIGSKCIRQMLLALNYIHHSNIIHRDIKPENWLFATKESMSTAKLKLIDFGFARRFDPTVKLTTQVGTPFYLAPEVLEGEYDARADIWSLGVMVYLLLSGALPFVGRTITDTLDLVLVAPLEISGSAWDEISEDAKLLIKACLQRDLNYRPTAQEVLEYRWIRLATDEGRQSKAPSKVALLNLKSYTTMHKVKKAALTVIATQLTEDSLTQLKEEFILMDTNKDGTLSIKEIREGMSKSGAKLPADFEKLVEEVDNDGSGSIDYTEFLAATLDRRVYYEKDIVWRAFKRFDIDGSGAISKSELKHVLGDDEVQGAMQLSCKQVEEELDKLFDQIDGNGDGMIDFDEFFAMVGGHDNYTSARHSSEGSLGRVAPRSASLNVSSRSLESYKVKAPKSMSLNLASRTAK